MAIINLGQQDLEIGNDWHTFTPAVAAAGDVIPLRLSLISPAPSDLISKAIIRYKLDIDYPNGDYKYLLRQENCWYADDQQIIEVTIPPYLPTVGAMVVEARRFYRFRSFNPGSTMELQIEFDTDEVTNVNQPDDKFRIFTHGAIAANTVGVLDFSGVTGLWRIYSVWLDMTGVTASDAMEITINNGGNVTSYWNLPATDVPWSPPPNIVGAANTIFIRPTADVANVVLYAKEAELDGVVAV